MQNSGKIAQKWCPSTFPAARPVLFNILADVRRVCINLNGSCVYVEKACLCCECQNLFSKISPGVSVTGGVVVCTGNVDGDVVVPSNQTSTSSNYQNMVQSEKADRVGNDFLPLGTFEISTNKTLLQNRYLVSASS